MGNLQSTLVIARRGLCGLVVVAGLAQSGGCSSNAEMFAYVSETHSPKTVTLLDTSTGTTIQVWDVPVGQQLNMQFDRKPAEAEKRGSDLLRYALRPVGESDVTPGGTITTPPPSSRRIDVTLRKGPEMRVPDTGRRTTSVPTEGR